MNRTLDRRIAALEGRHQIVTTSAWEPILAELSEEALEDLHYLIELAHPDPESPSWKVEYSEPPGWDGPEWIASGPEAERRYKLWHRANFPTWHPPKPPARLVAGPNTPGPQMSWRPRFLTCYWQTPRTLRPLSAGSRSWRHHETP